MVGPCYHLHTAFDFVFQFRGMPLDRAGSQNASRETPNTPPASIAGVGDGGRQTLLIRGRMSISSGLVFFCLPPVIALSAKTMAKKAEHKKTLTCRRGTKATGATTSTATAAPVQVRASITFRAGVTSQTHISAWSKGQRWLQQGRGTSRRLGANYEVGKLSPPPKRSRNWLTSRYTPE